MLRQIFNIKSVLIFYRMTITPPTETKLLGWNIRIPPPTLIPHVNENKTHYPTLYDNYSNKLSDNFLARLPEIFVRYYVRCRSCYCSRPKFPRFINSIKTTNATKQLLQ